MSCVRGVCLVYQDEMVRVCNEGMYRRFGMGVTAKEMNCEMVESLRHCAFLLSGHMMKMDDFVKRVYKARLIEEVSEGDNHLNGSIE